MKMAPDPRKRGSGAIFMSAFGFGAESGTALWPVTLAPGHWW
jgi:hypothetical protein